MKQMKSFLAALLALLLVPFDLLHRRERPVMQERAASATVQEPQEPEHVEEENTQPASHAQVTEDSIGVPFVPTDDSEWWITQLLTRSRNKLLS